MRWHSPRRYVGLIYLVLTVGVVTGALVVSQHFQLGVAQTIVTVLPGAPGLYLAWAAFRWGGNPDPTPPELADQLAIAVSMQWDAEAQQRRLYDPHPLPVSWTPADAALVDDWSSLVRLAASWPDGSADKDSTGSGKPVTPADLAGSAGDMLGVLNRLIPTRRLVILGAPGSGKTMLLVRLVLDLLAARSKDGGPVPVLVPLASWNPTEQDLHSWVITRLATDYPGMREPASASTGRTSRLRTLLESKQLLLLLDGLDELPEDLIRPAIIKINDALRPGEPVVLSSRTEQYKDAVNAGGGSSVRLRGAYGVELDTLDPSDVGDYLKSDAGSRAAADRWQPVLAVLGTLEPVALAFCTPLMVGLARTIYNPRLGEQITWLADPAELCDPRLFLSRDAVELHLFDAFIPAAYRHHPGLANCRWTAAQAENWLVYLAKHLADNLGGTTDLAWWELRQAVPRPLGGLAAGLVGGAAIGLAAWLGPRLGIGIGVGLLVGLCVGMAFRLRIGVIGGTAGGVAGGAAGGILGGFLGGVAGGSGATAGLVGGLALGIGVGPVSGLIGGFVGCLAGGIAVGLTAGHATGIAAGLIDGLGATMALALCATLSGRVRPARGLRGLHWTPTGLGIGTIAGTGVGITVGLATEPTTGVAAGVTVGLVSAIALGLEGAPARSEVIANPVTALARDRATFLGVGLAAAVAFGLGGGLGVWIGVGLAAALAVGLGVGFLQAAYGHFFVARCWLALRGHLPWRLMTFLADAHEKRGVLRQVGSVYQFRHAELQRRLSSKT